MDKLLVALEFVSDDGLLASFLDYYYTRADSVVGRLPTHKTHSPEDVDGRGGQKLMVGQSAVDGDAIDSPM